jgi:DNA-binding response OmpR family regulator
MIMNNIPTSILLIENNSLSRQNMAVFFENFGYQVTQTEDGEEAVKLINDIKFDVVITDLQLQCMVSGLDILASHKKVSPEAKTFLITAFGSDEVSQEAASLGAIYVQKPIRLSELLTLVRG